MIFAFRMKNVFKCLDILAQRSQPNGCMLQMLAKHDINTNATLGPDIEVRKNDKHKRFSAEKQKKKSCEKQKRIFCLKAKPIFRPKNKNDFSVQKQQRLFGPKTNTFFAAQKQNRFFGPNATTVFRPKSKSYF